MILTDYPWYAGALCLVAGAAFAAVLYLVGRRRFKPAVQWLLAGLRFATVSAVAWLLTAPVVRRQVNEVQRPHVVVAQDVSLSVRQGADSAFRADRALEGLDGRFRTTRIDFGGEGWTDLGAVLEQCRADDVDALVLASDGIHNRGAHPLPVAERLAFPVYTVALGDTTPQRDARLADLRCNRIALLGSEFPIEVAVGADLLQGRSARLTISNAAGKTLFAQTVEYTTDHFFADLATTLKAEGAGLQRYRVRIEAAEGERTLENNELTFYVDVIDTRRKVTIFANAPHPDLAALRRAIDGNANYEATVVMAADAESGRWHPDGEPQLAVLHNLPSADHPDVGYAAQLPCLYVVGLQTDLGRFNALHSGLEIDSRAAKSNEVTAVYQPAFSYFTLDEGDARTIEEWPPLSAPFGQARTSESVQTLFSARLASIDTRQPLVAASSQGGRRQVFVWGEGLWRWRMANWQTGETHEVFDRLLSQMLGFAAMQASRERLQVSCERSYAQGEPVELHAVRYNEAYEPANEADVELALGRTDDGGHRTDLGIYTFRRDGSGYALTLPALEEGLYRYRATSGELTAEGTFAVEAINLELRQLTANHNLLSTISATTGGAMYRPDQANALAERLAELKPTVYSHLRYAELTRLPWVLALILLLLAAEWALRKYHGEV